MVNATPTRKIDMSDNLRSLAKEHHAFYEVLPHYVMVEEKRGSFGAKRVQAGFDVEIYAANIKNDLALPGPDPVYALGYAEFKKIAENVSQHASGSCSLEVISFPSTVVVDSRNDGKVEAMFLIRISHCRGLDQPAGLPEQHALEEVENQLHELGVARR
jgi:hypothetical protein